MACRRGATWLHRRGAVLLLAVAASAIPSSATAAAPPIARASERPAPVGVAAPVDHCPLDGTRLVFLDTARSSDGVGLPGGGRYVVADDQVPPEAFYLDCRDPTVEYPYTLWSTTRRGYVTVAPDRSVVAAHVGTPGPRQRFGMTCHDLTATSAHCQLRALVNCLWVSVGMSPGPGDLRAAAVTAGEPERFVVSF